MKQTTFLILIIFTSIAAPGYSQTLKKNIPDKLVVLTFDDACASHYSFVAPLLKQYGFGATFFVCEFPPNFADSSKYMNWRQIKELDKMGFDIANHTHNHPLLTKINDEQIIKQISYIENKFDSMNIPRSNNFAYPACYYNESALKILKDRGYKLARIAGDKAYDPLKDFPMLIPSWCMIESNKSQIMDALKEAKDGKIVVLTIHGVPDIEHPWVNTPPALFKEYLKYLSDNHYKVISLKGLKDYISY
jgi:peptidoglycan-N-acetylglucosamine deacetylase